MERGRRLRQVGRPLARGVCAALLGSLLFLWLADPIRQAEAGAGGWLLRSLGVRGVGPTSDSAVLLMPRNGPVFFGVVTRSCSSAAALLCIGALTLIAVPGRRQRRVRALLAGCVVVTACNVARVAGVLWAGASLGQERVAPLHDLVGTPITLFGAAAGVVVWWRVLEGRLRETRPDGADGAAPEVLV